MKVFKSLSVFLIIVLFLTGCSQDETQQAGTQQAETETEASAKLINENKNAKSLSILKLPYNEVVWDDRTFSIKDARLYQEKVGHGYMLYAVIDYDMTSLSEDDIYWLTDAGTIRPPFDSNAYVTSEKNNLKTSSMRTLHRSLKDGILSYMYYSGIDEYQYDFSDARVSLCTLVEQKDGFDINYDIYCGPDETLCLSIQDISEMNDADQSAMQKGFDRLGERAIDYINSHS